MTRRERVERARLARFPTHGHLQVRAQLADRAIEERIVVDPRIEQRLVAW